MLKVIFLSKTIVKLQMYYFTFNDVFFFYVNLTFTSPLFFSALFGVNHENSRVICLSRFSMPTKKSCSPFDVNQHNAKKSEIGNFFSSYRYQVLKYYVLLVEIMLCFLFTIKKFPSVLAHLSLLISFLKKLHTENAIIHFRSSIFF